MKIQFIKSTTSVGFAYMGGDQLICSDNFGKLMIDKGFARKVDDTKCQTENFPLITDSLKNYKEKKVEEF